MATPSIMEVMQAMFNNLTNNMNINNNSLRAEINNKIDEMQSLNAAARIEMFELVDQRSRRSTRASTKTTSRAVSPKSLLAQKGSLTLKKCIEFQKDILDFQNKYNVEVRHTSYLSDELKAEMKARFDLTDSRFYRMVTQDLERYLSEMVAPVCKAEFLSMLNDTVHFSLPQGYIPTEQTLTTFLYQLLVYKERMFRAIEFILLYEGSDACLPACDTKPQGLLKLISDEVPHRFIELILQSDPPGTKYKDIYKFFTRVAVHTKRCEILHREAKFFRASFGGSKFEKAQLDALASSTSISASASRYDKSTPTITTEASTIKPPVPFSKWTPRAPKAVVAAMKAVEESDDEESSDENDEPSEQAANFSNNILKNEDPLPVHISALTASEMLTKACYRHVTKNYCGIPNCGYSHDPGIIAAARDQQIIDLTNANLSVICRQVTRPS